MLAAMTMDKTTILVLGLGNVLLTDEAAGVRLAEHVGALPEAAELGLQAMDGGTMGLTLMVAMEDADAMIVCDSAWLGEAPGAFKVFEGAEMDHFLRTRGRNPHDIGLDDVMDGLRLREAVPEKRALVGIQPEILTVGEHMTAAVTAAIPQAAEAVLALARRWRG